ncbi:MAG: hypothetical protein ACNS60_07855 [Candidatus Cyclobacteriaceae bacterium M2_1C_046]
MKKFNIGDVVCLNHSDVLLTVLEDEEKTGLNGHYRVCWFNEAGDFCSTTVPGDILRLEVKETPVQMEAS